MKSLLEVLVKTNLKPPYKSDIQIPIYKDIRLTYWAKIDDAEILRRIDVNGYFFKEHGIWNDINDRVVTIFPKEDGKFEWNSYHKGNWKHQLIKHEGDIDIEDVNVEYWKQNKWNLSLL